MWRYDLEVYLTSILLHSLQESTAMAAVTNPVGFTTEEAKDIENQVTKASPSGSAGSICYDIF